MDTLSVVWKHMYFYTFPPFILMGKVLSKAFREKTKAIIIIPNWPSQHWYRRILSLSCDMTLEHVLNFLGNLYNKGFSQSATVSAKYALATRMIVALY